ncbi:MAG: DNA-protecting protein DprA [Candidatus Improbicoccus devescovinae]|nr:MAG: DNA-protecting protein DprA [Candidatus Improbicoccus devescovinae]
MQDVLYWIWLQRSLNFGNHKVRFVMSSQNPIKDFYDSGERVWASYGIFKRNELENLQKYSLTDAQLVLDKCKRLGYNVIGFSDKNYPDLLKRIDNPPCVLYAKGDITCVNSRLVISIVGSRSASYFGSAMAFKTAYDLASEDVLIVSGGALGIDTASHKGAIAAQGQTVGILACGIDFPYLLTNENLRNQISENGVLISEYPPGYPMRNFNFYLRNRLISGISHGTIVVEAGKKSGALVTANFAAEQNRDVFVTPVFAENPLSEGIFELIEDGAKVIKDSLDIKKYYSNINFPPRPSNLQKRSKQLEFQESQVSQSCVIPQEHRQIEHHELTENMKIIINVLDHNKLHIDEIKILTGFKTHILSTLLAQLELWGIINVLPGRVYQVNL